ncbi:hypothetical protein Rhopal_006205-T1 [Rhodotorula paludigena]|uniref:Potassium channel domain-containing protein n=1 Tax=Rhodotorula paludigena TaxID=86838 RepID=A0AAV5GX97_9BASI|nr:hypothetical protein Rhopal_006205-T1 [Rhodotorula paludigena]
MGAAAAADELTRDLARPSRDKHEPKWGEEPAGARTPTKGEELAGGDDDNGDEGDDAEEEAAEEEIEQEQEDDREADERGLSAWLNDRIRARKQKREGGDDESSAGGSRQNDLEVSQRTTRLLPILSGLVCPFSVLLDIPGLTERWYVRTYGFEIVETRPNPALLDAGQAVSLAFGVFANVALICRFLEHRPRLFTWVAMVSLTVHDILSISIVTWFGVAHRFSDGFTYNDAFWLSVAATAASTVCNVTLALDLLFTKNFDTKGSGLTEKQRTLVIAAMAFFLYIGLGALIFSFLIDALRFIDAMYFSICLVTSVGFGDILPVSTGSRVFTMFYVPGGIVLLALLVAMAHESIVETFEQAYRTRRDQLASRAKERREAIRKKHLEARERRRIAREKQQQQLGADDKPEECVSEKSASAPQPQASSAAVVWASSTGLARRCGEKLVTESMPVRRSRVHRLMSALHLRRSRSSTESVVPLDPEVGAQAANNADDDGGAPFRRSTTSASSSSAVTTATIDASFRMLKEQLGKEQRRDFRLRLGISVSLFLVFWFAGAGIFTVTEPEWNYFDALWFALVTFTTLGLGDFSPQSSAGRAFFVVWALLGIANMTLLLSVLTDAWQARYKSSIKKGRFKRVIRRINRKKRESPTAPARQEGSGVTQLLAEEGYVPLGAEGDGTPLAPEELPDKLVQTVRGFHAHARYFMLGRTGDPPRQLGALLEAAEEGDLRLEQLVKTGMDALADSGAQGDTKHPSTSR